MVICYQLKDVASLRCQRPEVVATRFEKKKLKERIFSFQSMPNFNFSELYKRT